MSSGSTVPPVLMTETKPAPPYTIVAAKELQLVSSQQNEDEKKHLSTATICKVEEVTVDNNRSESAIIQAMEPPSTAVSKVEEAAVDSSRSRSVKRPLSPGSMEYP